MFFRKYTLVALLILLICGVDSQWTPAQQVDKLVPFGRISGKIFDKLTNKPVQFASFIVISSKDSSNIFGSESDSSGYFHVEKIPFGQYRAKVSLIGYQSRTRKNIVLTPVKYELRIDSLMLMPFGITKKDVEIIAKKERIVYDKDNKNKITINPDKDWGVNALELLENTPMVHVDFEEKNITLMGKNISQILVDGRPGVFTGIETVEDLKLMSADEIESFELIINPSAEYSHYIQMGENSSGGVINIISKRKVTSSYTGKAGLVGNSDNRYNGNLDGRYNSSTLSGGLNYMTSNSEHKTNNSTIRQITFGNSTDIMNQSSESNNRNLTNRYSLRLSMNSQDNYNIMNSTSFNEGYNTIGRTSDNSYLGNNYNSSTLSKNLLKLFNTSLSFSKTLPGPGHSFNSNISYGTNRMNIDNNYNRRNLLSYQTMADTTISGNDKSDNSNNNYRLNFSYRNLFSRFMDFSAGYSGFHLEMLMNSDYLLYDPVNTTNLTLDNKKIRLKYINNTHSVPISISGSALSIAYTVSLNTNMKSSSAENAIGNYSYKNNFLSFDPGCRFMTIILGGMVSFAYYGTTSFPNNNQLNPYTDYSDSTNLKSGNPDLKPTTMKSYTLGYDYFGSELSLGISGKYSIFKDQVNSIITPVSPLVTMTSYANVASSDIINLDLYLRKEFSKSFDLSCSIAANKSNYYGMGVQNIGKDWSWSSSLNPNLKLGIFRFEADINYSSSTYSVQQKTKPVWYMDAAAKLLLLNKTLTLTLRASDLFNSRSSNSDNYGTGFIINNNVKQVTRIVSLSISYFFRLTAQETIEVDKPYDVLPEEF
jgi:hypothetical protein